MEQSKAEVIKIQPKQKLIQWKNNQEQFELDDCQGALTQPGTNKKPNPQESPHSPGNQASQNSLQVQVLRESNLQLPSQIVRAVDQNKNGIQLQSRKNSGSDCTSRNESSSPKPRDLSQMKIRTPEKQVKVSIQCLKKKNEMNESLNAEPFIEKKIDQLAERDPIKSDYSSIMKQQVTQLQPFDEKDQNTGKDINQDNKPIKESKTPGFASQDPSAYLPAISKIIGASKQGDSCSEHPQTSTTNHLTLTKQISFMPSPEEIQLEGHIQEIRQSRRLPDAAIKALRAELMEEKAAPDSCVTHSQQYQKLTSKDTSQKQATPLSLVLVHNSQVSPGFQTYEKKRKGVQRTPTALDKSSMLQNQFRQNYTQPVQEISMAPRPRVFIENKSHSQFRPNLYQNSFQIPHNPMAHNLNARPRWFYDSPARHGLGGLPMQSPSKHNIDCSPLKMDYEHENAGLSLFRTEKPLKQHPEAFFNLDYQQCRNFDKQTPKRKRLESDAESLVCDEKLNCRRLDFNRPEIFGPDRWPNLDAQSRGQSPIFHFGGKFEHFNNFSSNVHGYNQPFGFGLQGHLDHSQFPPRKMSNHAQFNSSMRSPYSKSNPYKSSFMTPNKDSNQAVAGGSSMLKRSEQTSFARVNDFNQQNNILTSNERLPTCETNRISEHLNSAQQVQHTPLKGIISNKESFLGQESVRRQLLDKFNTAGKKWVGQNQIEENNFEVNQVNTTERERSIPLESILPEASDIEQRLNIGGQRLQTPQRNKTRGYATPKVTKREQSRNVEMVTPQIQRTSRGGKSRKPTNDVDTPSQSSKNQTGLKTIAGEVIEILKDREFMTYNEAAVIIVNKHLKDKDSCNDNSFSNDEVSQNPDCASQHMTSPKPTKLKNGRHSSSKKKRQRAGQKRSSREDNLRRRIYDAWNVLKAASIIVEHDDKNYWMNQKELQSLMNYRSSSEESEEDSIIQQIALSHRSPLKSKRVKMHASETGSPLKENVISEEKPVQVQLNNEEGNQTEAQKLNSKHEEQHNLSEEALKLIEYGLDLNTVDLEAEIKKMESTCAQKYQNLNSRLKEASNQVKNIVDSKRLIKRNRALHKREKKPVKRKKQIQSMRDSKRQRKEAVHKAMHIPFIVVTYEPISDKEEDLPEGGMPGVQNHEKHCKITSKSQFACYGDMTILHKMREKNLLPENTLSEIFGKEGGEKIENTFMAAQNVLGELKQKHDSIVQIHENLI